MPWKYSNVSRRFFINLWISSWNLNILFLPPKVTQQCPQTLMTLSTPELFILHTSIHLFVFLAQLSPAEWKAMSRPWSHRSSEVAINIILGWIVSFPSWAFRPGYLVSFTLCQRLDEKPFTRFITCVAKIKLWACDNPALQSSKGGGRELHRN